MSNSTTIIVCQSEHTLYARNISGAFMSTTRQYGRASENTTAQLNRGGGGGGSNDWAGYRGGGGGGSNDWAG